MIFVTVGTHEQQFNRLLEAVDEIISSGVIPEDEKVIVQSGYCTYRMQHATEQHQFIPHDEMLLLIQQARIVITHGGPSSFLPVVQSGKIPIVMPRRSEFHEHVNDHQVDFTHAVEQRLHNIIITNNTHELLLAIQEVSEIQRIGRMQSKPHNKEFCSKLNSVVDSLFINTLPDISIPGQENTVTSMQKSSPLISVVIRTYNEEKHIGDLLESLQKQTFDDYEVIVVDSESTDSTTKIAKQYAANIVSIQKKDFNYSYASNIGVKHSHGKIVCFLSGHSVPVSNTYLEQIAQVFQNNSIGGCYGDVIALPDGSITEKLYNKLGYLKNKIMNRDSDIIIENNIHAGVLSCSNAAILRELLIQHPFVDALGKGGEDVELAYRILKDEYSIARIPSLLVYHSHGLGPIQFFRQLKAWKSMYRAVLEYIRVNP